MKVKVLEEELAEKLKKESLFFGEMLKMYENVDYRTFLLAWSELRSNHQLARDEEGRYKLT